MSSTQLAPPLRCQRLPQGLGLERPDTAGWISNRRAYSSVILWNKKTRVLHKMQIPQDPVPEIRILLVLEWSPGTCNSRNFSGDPNLQPDVGATLPKFTGSSVPSPLLSFQNPSSSRGVKSTMSNWYIHSSGQRTVLARLFPVRLLN